MYNKKALSKAKAELDKAKAPKKPKDIITDPMGQWKYPGLPTRIPGNDITMEGVGYPVLGVANNGQRKIMLPGADYTFPGADYVDEYPQMKRGGTRKRRKTKSLSGTNELMLPHPLLRNYKNRVYDPNVDYFQEGGISSLEGDLISKVIMERNKDKDFVQRAYALGENPGTSMFNAFEPDEFGQTMSHKMAWGEDDNGQAYMFPTVMNPKNEAIRVPNQYADYISNEGYKRATGMIPAKDYIEAELTDDEIEEYRKGGYIVEDISVPELNQARKGKIVNTNQLPKPSVYIAKNDKDYAFRKKAYDDSLALYNLDKDYSNLSLKAAKLINDPNSDESKYFDIQDKLKKNYSEQYKILKNSNVPHKLIPIKERIKGDRAMMHPKPTQTIVKPNKQEADKTKENSKFITNKSKEKILEISDPAEYAYRKRMYEDSLNSYNTGKKVYTNVGEIFEKLNPGGEYINNNFLSFYQNPDKKPNYGTNSKGVSPKGYGKKFKQDLSRIYFSTPAEKKAWYNVAKNLSELDNLNTKPIRTINQAEIPTLFVYKKPTQKVVLKTENKPVQDTIIQKPVVQQEVKPIIQQNIKPVQKINYPEGYQPYSLYGRLLDPEVYGYGESINNKPVELAQGADMMLKKMQMEKYKKSGKYPWSKQNGGLIEAQTGRIKTHKSKDGTVTNTITKPNGDVVVQVKTKDGRYYEKVKKGLPQFVKDEFKKRADWENRSSGAAQPVDEFWTLPIGMTSAGVKGTVGLAKGLGSLASNVSKSSLVQAGKTGTKALFKAAPKWAPGMNLGNAIGSGFAGSALTDVVTGKVAEPWKKASKSGKGSDYVDAVTENMFTALDAIPVYGAGSKGLKQLGKYATTETPLKNAYKILGKDTKFYNPGEKPHWLKGYTESWNPMKADLEPLANFRENQAVKNLQNRNISKEHDAVNDKFSQILKDLSNEKQIALKANDEKAVSEINAKLDDVFNARLKEHNKIAKKHFQSKQHPFEERIGAGGFGTVYGLPESEFVIKVGQVPKNESILKLVENAKGINKSNIALPKRASATSSGENVIVMNKVEPVEGNIFTNPPTKESYEQLIKDVEELQGKGIYLDFENPQNIQYNPKTGLFNIYDLNTTGHVLHKTLPKNSYKAGEKTIEQLLIDNKKLPLDWNKKVSKQLSTLQNLNKEEIVKASLDGNFLTRPLTLFTKNEMLGTPDKKMLYRKIGNAKGLQDLIEKQGAQAPKPMTMTSGATIDTPFFGAGTKPNENYGGLFAVEVDPSNPKYSWSNNVGGVSNYGVAPYNPETGELIKNIPLEDLNVYKKKWFSNNYKKLKPEELEAALMFAREQALIENAYKWGVRGVAADQIFNDGEYSKAIQNYFLGKPNISRKKRIDAEDDYEKGGIVADLTPEEIQDYIAKGYIVEDID